ncbi:hypothetical protein PHLCEN_2v12665 [Hermanssonia centrifuga]|uniref:Uncharacterized protein n=1 Tax=Hermanssonia centrifuga TaxID=98765 RepID=A0A2R6NGM9_9APHY|nr:hypothetical protein PHLCEN_2v12665 [Hermanssonia centrifuga]
MYKNPNVWSTPKRSNWRGGPSSAPCSPISPLLSPNARFSPYRHRASPKVLFVNSPSKASGSTPADTESPVHPRKTYRPRDPPFPAPRRRDPNALKRGYKIVEVYNDTKAPDPDVSAGSPPPEDEDEVMFRAQLKKLKLEKDLFDQLVKQSDALDKAQQTMEERAEQQRLHDERATQLREEERLREEQTARQQEEERRQREVERLNHLHKLRLEQLRQAKEEEERRRKLEEERQREQARREEEYRRHCEQLERERLLREEESRRERERQERVRVRFEEECRRQRERQERQWAKFEEERKRQHEQRAREEAEREQLRREEAERERLRREGMQRQSQGLLSLYDRCEQTWAGLRRVEALSLAFHQLPWPVLSYSAVQEDAITLENVKNYVFNPQRPNPKGKTAKEILREEMLRWHPDKFNAAFLSKVQACDQERVKAAASLVMVWLNNLKAELKL